MFPTLRSYVSCAVADYILLPLSKKVQDFYCAAMVYGGRMSSLTCRKT